MLSLENTLLYCPKFNYADMDFKVLLQMHFSCTAVAVDFIKIFGTEYITTGNINAIVSAFDFITFWNAFNIHNLHLWITLTNYCTVHFNHIKKYLIAKNLNLCDYKIKEPLVYPDYYSSAITYYVFKKNKIKHRKQIQKGEVQYVHPGLLHHYSNAGIPITVNHNYIVLDLNPQRYKVGCTAKNRNKYICVADGKLVLEPIYPKLIQYYPLQGYIACDTKIYYNGKIINCNLGVLASRTKYFAGKTGDFKVMHNLSNLVKFLYDCRVNITNSSYEILVAKYYGADEYLQYIKNHIISESVVLCRFLRI